MLNPLRAHHERTPNASASATPSNPTLPLVTITLADIEPDRIQSASGLSNFVRITAGAFGASIATTVWQDRAAIHHAQLSE